MIPVPAWLRPSVALARHPEAVIAVAVESVDPDLAARWIGLHTVPGEIRALGYDDEIVSIYEDLAACWREEIGAEIGKVLAGAEDGCAWIPASLLRAPLRAWAAAAATEALQVALTGDDPIAPAYPDAERETARAVALGFSPRDVSGLTSSEAHRWLSEGGDVTPATWLLQQSGIDAIARSVGVARWALACLSDDRAPALRARMLEHLDLVDPRDVTSEADGVSVVELRGSMRRASTAHGLARVPEWHQRGRVLRCVTQLREPSELVRWGDRESHCVGMYADRVASGKSIIYAITVYDGQRMHRSTVEVGRMGREVQHQGKANTSPPELCRRAWALQRRIWGL